MSEGVTPGAGPVLPNGVGVRWYRQSTADHDTHRGTVNRGSLHTVCGIRFRPQAVLLEPPADLNQMCRDCQASRLAAPSASSPTTSAKPVA